jgi:nitronate monooxygenase
MNDAISSGRQIPGLWGAPYPLLLAPMAGAADAKLAIAVAGAGGLGSIACAMLTPAQVREGVATFRRASTSPLNLNFFCHQPPSPDAAREAGWRARLQPYYMELGLDPAATAPQAGRSPFDAAACALVEELRPEVVSFHFGLPEADLLTRVKATGAKILSTATTVEEGMWLEAHGCDAIIAQGIEAGGHRGLFLGNDLSSQIGTMALVPQMVSAVRVPVIATGGIGDGRGIAAALMLGASAVQLGTAFLLCPESKISAVHRTALRERSRPTALTNLFSGRPARGLMNRLMREIGPLSDEVPAFPLAGNALAALRAENPDDFGSLWAGQAYPMARETPAAAELTAALMEEAYTLLAGGAC